MKQYTAIARTLGALHRCEQSGNEEWTEKHGKTLDDLCDSLPSGSGFDSGTKLDRDESTGDKLVFHTAFHHMNENGMYDGWTEHDVVVTPSLELGYHIKVTGRDRNDIKDYIADCMNEFLNQDIEA